MPARCRPASILETGKPYVWVNGGLSHIEAAPEDAPEGCRSRRGDEEAAIGDSGAGGWPKREPINAELKPVPPFDPRSASRSVATMDHGRGGAHALSA